MTDYFKPSLPQDDLLRISALGLAHMGDCVFELMVRCHLCLHGKTSAKNLHRETVSFVAAPAQAARVQKILPLLTQEEMQVFKRGRNTNVNSVPKGAKRSDYQTATALECLFGWLYLRGEITRLNMLFSHMIEEENDAT